MRRRMTGAWARLGSLTPAAGAAAVRRVSGAFPSAWSASGAPGPSVPPAKQPSGGKSKALVAGASVLAVLAVGGVIVAPKLLNGGGASSDPGCKTYAGTALPSYNKAIGDLNAQATQSVLTADMSAATTDLTKAINQSHGAAVKSALTGLLTELRTVDSGVHSGSVPASMVSALNAASAKAGQAC